MRYFSLAHTPIRSTQGILITLTLDGTSSRHVRILFANRTSISRHYDSRDKRRLRSHRKHGVTSRSSAGLRTTLQNVGNRQRTDTPRYKVLIPSRQIGTRQGFTKWLWLRTRIVTLPKILKRVITRCSDTKTWRTTNPRASRTQNTITIITRAFRIRKFDLMIFVSS